MTTNGTGPLSWRDVYKAVGDAESRLLKAIDDLRATVTGSTMDHEARLRKVESYMEGVPPEERTKLIARIGVLEQRVNFFSNREEGLKMAGRFANIGLHIFFSLVGAIGTVLTLMGVGAFK